MSNDGFEDLRAQAKAKAELDQKSSVAKSKKIKAVDAKASTADKLDAIMADLDLIKAKLGI